MHFPSWFIVEVSQCSQNDDVITSHMIFGTYLIHRRSLHEKKWGVGSNPYLGSTQVSPTPIRISLSHLAHCPILLICTIQYLLNCTVPSCPLSHFALPSPSCIIRILTRINFSPGKKKVCGRPWE